MWLFTAENINMPRSVSLCRMPNHRTLQVPMILAPCKYSMTGPLNHREGVLQFKISANEATIARAT